MSVVSWNCDGGSAARIELLVEPLARIQWHAILLQEVRESIPARSRVGGHLLISMPCFWRKCAIMVHRSVERFLSYSSIESRPDPYPLVSLRFPLGDGTSATHSTLSSPHISPSRSEATSFSIIGSHRST